MSIFINKDTRVIVQGGTGREGLFHTKAMLDYGTKVVGAVTPGKGGQVILDRVPVYNTVAEAVKATEANTSCIFVPARFAPEAMVEAADGGIGLVVCITENVPTLDMLEITPYFEGKGIRLIGPNCPGLISPGQAKVGIIPNHVTMPGPVGLVSRSGTLTYEVIAALTARGIAFLSLPTAERDTTPESMASVGEAMRAHVPGEAWEQVVQIHGGGEALKQAFGWQADVFAKLLRVTREGGVRSRHDEGPFSDEALAAFLG